MMKTRRFRFSQRRVDRVLAKVAEGPFDVASQQRAQIPRDTVADENPLDDNALAVRGQRVGRHLPAAVAQPVRQIKKAESGTGARFDRPAYGWDAPVHAATVDDFKETQLLNLSGEVLSRLVTGGVDLAIPFLSQAKEVVILADDLAARP